MPRRVRPTAARVAADAAVASAGLYAALLGQQRFEHARAGVDPRWVRRHDDDEGRWCRQFETSTEPCGHAPPHEVRCCNAGLHDDLEAGRAVVVPAASVPWLVRDEWRGPGWQDPARRDPRRFRVTPDDQITELETDESESGRVPGVPAGWVRITPDDVVQPADE